MELNKKKGKGKGCRALIGALLLGVLLSSCVTDPTFKAYVQAHRLSWEARNDTYISLVEESTKISPEDKLIIKRKEAQEEEMIKAAEKHLGLK